MAERSMRALSESARPRAAPPRTTRCGWARRRSSGVTLIELMITVVIVAILASIAIPSYNAQIRKSHRTEAKTALLDLAGREERYYAANPSTGYSNLPSDMGYAATLPTLTNYPVGSGYFNVTVTTSAAIPTNVPPTPAGYSITATALNDQANDSCTTFTVNQTGAQTATGTYANPTQECWK